VSRRNQTPVIFLKDFLKVMCTSSPTFRDTEIQEEKDSVEGTGVLGFGFFQLLKIQLYCIFHCKELADSQSSIHNLLFDIVTSYKSHQ